MELLKKVGLGDKAKAYPSQLSADKSSGLLLPECFFGYVIGLPLGIALTLTDKGGIAPNRTVYHILDSIINITRSIPFLILLILVMPLTKLIVGKSYVSQE